MSSLALTELRTSALVRRFGIDYRLARFIADLIGGANINPLAVPLLGVAIDSGGGVYYYNGLLGSGATGKVYSASRDGSLEQEFVVKEFRLNAVDTQGEPLEQELQRWHIEKEFAVGRVIRRRLGDLVCDENIVCPLDRFYSADGEVGYIVFPFSGTRTLEAYLTSYLYQRMRAFREQLTQSGLGTQTAETLLQLTRSAAIQADVARQALRELRDIQLIAIQLVRQIVMAVALLHHAHVSHQDLKPDNLLVDDVYVRVIDFGLACAFPRDGDEQFEEIEQRFFACDEVYNTTPDYEDPLAQYLRAENLLEQLVLFARFDTYAAGKLVQTIFDPTVYDPEGRRRRFPVVQRTEFMLPGVYELIVRMTGEERYVPPLMPSDPERVYDLRLTETEFQRRLALLDTRIDMNTASQTVSQIINDWGARLAQSGAAASAAIGKTGTARDIGSKRRRVQRLPPVVKNI